MSEIKLSFIIPVYNVEKFVGECLESIYCQGISEELFEVICIDDCSPDNSKSIVLHFKNKHSNLRLIEHDINKGLGGARNTGIVNAKGEYIWFIDSDDTIVENCLDKIFNLLSNYPETLLFNYNNWNPNISTKLKTNVFTDSIILSGLLFVDKYFDSSIVYHLGYVWRVIVKRDLLINNKLYFPENTWGEDTGIFPAMIFFSNAVISTSDAFYNYRLNLNSISNTLKHKKKARLIYEFAFGSALELKKFNHSIKHVYPKYHNIFNMQVKKFSNQFIFELLKTNYIEKVEFFKLINQHKIDISTLIIEMKPFNRFLCKNPILGLIIVTFISPLYQLKRKMQRK